MRDFDSRRSEAWFQATLLGVAAFWLFDLLVLRSGAADPLDDSWEYLSVARSLLEGHGFRTAVIHPPLWSLRDAALTVPVLVHGPLLPLLLAPLLALFGPGVSGAIAWLAAGFAIATAAVLQRLGSRTMGAEVGTAAACLFTLSPLVVRAVHHDIALPLGALLLALAVDHSARPQPRGARAGVALGLGVLVRPEFLLVLAALLVLTRSGRRRLAFATLGPALPWMWHSVVHAGSPVFNLSSYLLIGYWGERPGISVLRDFGIPPHAWPAALRDALPNLPAKWLDFAPHALKRSLMAPGGATGWLVPIGLLAALQHPRSRRFAGLAGVLLPIPFVIMTATLYDPRYLTPFLALFALAAARGGSEAAKLLPRWAQTPRTWLGVLLLLTLPSAGPALHEAWREAREARQRLRSETAALTALASRVEGGAARVIFTDTPDFVAWTTRRAAVWQTGEEYARLPAWSGEGDLALAMREHPVRSGADVCWFHDAEGRGSVLPAASGTGARSAAPGSTAPPAH